VANEVAIGLTMPRAAIEICRQRLTPSHFNRAVILAQNYAPTDAVEAGFLDRLVDGPELLETAQKVATELAQLDRAAHVATKSRARESSIAAIRKGLEIDQKIFGSLNAAPAGNE
jgi:enoyl-CoA hydratase